MRTSKGGEDGGGGGGMSWHASLDYDEAAYVKLVGLSLIYQHMNVMAHHFHQTCNECARNEFVGPVATL